MKFTCPKETMQNILGFAQNIVNNKSTLSILSNVLIETEGKQSFYITATDLEIGARCKVQAEVAAAGSVTLPAKKLFDVIRDFPVKDITIEISDKHVASITSANSLAKIVGLPKDEFPKFPVIKKEQAITLAQAVLKQMLHSTVYAISDDTTRYVLTGLLVSFKNNVITMVATDGKRLSLIKQKHEMEQGFKKDIIIPSKTIHELLRILKEEGDVEISFLDNQVGFTIDNIVLVSRLIEGHFPDYEQVIPKKTEEKVNINREELLGAVSRAAIFTDKKSNSIKLQMKAGKLIALANIAELGESKEEIDIAYQGKELAIAFNPAYLIDVLKAVETEEVKFEFTDAESPGVIRTGEDFTYVIMPMRIS